MGIKKEKSSITLSRTGFFKCIVFGPNHCAAVPDGEIQFKYELTVKCKRDLDVRGFLYDQLVAQKHFSGIYKTDLSCEEFTERNAIEIRSEIRRLAPHVKMLNFKLSISTEPYNTSCTYEEDFQ